MTTIGSGGGKSVEVGGYAASKGKQREIDPSSLVARAESTYVPFIPGLMVPSSTAASSATASPTSVASPTSSTVKDPITTIHHNTPLILCIVIGAVIITATLSVGLAWVLRLACCAGERRARRKRRLDRSTWSPSDHASKLRADEMQERTSLDSVTVSGDDDLERKDAKIDNLFTKADKGEQFNPDVPVLTYADAGVAHGTPVSTWNGKGWTLFDPPVAAIKKPEPAATDLPRNSLGGGNYAAARKELADQDVGGFTWPSSVERQPSFIERLVQRHHQASDLPTAATLPYPFQAKSTQPASRMASLGGAANRAVMNMLPVTLRNAATTASRQRATRKRYHDMQPYLDSDFEGTIGGKDRELPMARRLRRTEERMAVDWTTEEEGESSPARGSKKHPLESDLQTFARVQPALIASPMVMVEGSKAAPQFTPGMAGVGAVWSKRGSFASLLPETQQSIVAGSSAKPTQLPKVIEPNRASLLPFPALEGDRRGRLLGNVGRWLGQVTEAGEIADPYTALSPRPDRRITKNGSLRSDYTSTTLANTATATNSETHVDARTSTSGAGKSERLLERVDADQAEHDRQQRRLLRKARMFTPAANVACNAPQDISEAKDVVAAEEMSISRAGSIRPHFCATTDLKSWLEPNKVSTTHGLKVLEESEAASSVAADPFASDAERAKPRILDARTTKKLRSSSSRDQLRKSAKDASRQKRANLRPVNSVVPAKAGGEPLSSRCQSSAAITVVSSVFDEAFAAEYDRVNAATKKRSGASKSNDDAKAKAKAEADAAMREAWRRRRMLSISSRGSQTTRSAQNRSAEIGRSLLSREESIVSQPSVYSELTAASDYAFQAPILSGLSQDALPTGCGSSTDDAVSEEQEVSGSKGDAARQAEVDTKKQSEKQAKKDARREQRRAERRQAKKAASISAGPIPATSAGQTAPMDSHRSVPTDLAGVTGNAEAVRRIIKKQRSISLGAVRSQFPTQPADVSQHASAAPDSPWTSSDSDISVRRWGEARRDDTSRIQIRASSAAVRHHHSQSIPTAMTDLAVKRGVRSTSKGARSNSYYFGMGAGGDVRDFC
ncbi:hypothetical protein PHSY_006746 [Pseudozyma hubeiensis SY62]|uniref:Uncharacterized protein n=1 Tax=Pseudozyma hubeiensis (strain SY62) TaxID=1305764 RepID=R9PD18_PSEHS|nr:hypothetical protein PHSY_006746 [Pseudozyma hubeiensis SY62]GAC99147.1 hypothetical protein PHSY_006746 [Pseudozyma hubeiensis SY62]